MRKIFLLLLFFAMIFFACKKGDTGPQGPAGSNNPAPLPIACFTVNDTLTLLDSAHVFSFTNCSQNAVRYEWDFDDFTYAPVANPSHIYNQYGIFTVRMTAYNADNVSSQTSHVVTIGFYSLNKIEYYQLYSILTMPVTVSLYNSSFNVSDIINQGQLPFTSLLADSDAYHFFPPAVSYYLRTQDGSGHNYNRVFSVAVSSIVNNRFDTLFTLGSDTTRFTLYYKIDY
jgi:PKD repeat protein